MSDKDKKSPPPPPPPPPPPTRLVKGDVDKPKPKASKDKELKFHRNCVLIVHPTIRNSASIKDFRGSFCSLLQTALKSSLNATLAMICLKSEKAKLLRPLTL